jgi:hypothetical protein
MTEPGPGAAATFTGAGRPEVLWILGILQRSGTNYLRDLMALHPDCCGVDNPGEDFLVAHADKLQQYVRGVTRDWNRSWDPRGELREQLTHALGEACVSFLVSRAVPRPGTTPRFVITKSPSVGSLPLLSWFPRSRAVVIVRDGRDMIVSGMKSFGWDFETACRQWADAARTIGAAKSAGAPFLLIRYEDLLANLRGTLTEIFSYLQLDVAAYDFDAAAGLPVKGSSSFGTQDGSVHWRPVEKTDGFKPVGRWANWGARRHERFNWIAGKESAGLGYDLVRLGYWPTMWNLWNRWQDTMLAWAANWQRAKRVWQRVRKKTKSDGDGKGPARSVAGRLPPSAAPAAAARDSAIRPEDGRCRDR